MNKIKILSKRIGKIFLIYFIGFLISIIGIGIWNTIWIILSLWIIIAIRLHPKNWENAFILKERLTNYKNYKIRLLITIILIPMLVLMTISNQKNQISKNNTPKPVITINSSKNNQWQNTWYNLQTEILNAKNILINWKSINLNTNNKYNEIIPLYKQETQIKIIAKNDYWTTEESFIINREKTNEEIKNEEELKKKEEERIRQQKEQKELEKKKNEEYLNSPEYKNKVIKEKIDEIIKTQELQLTKQCTDWIKPQLLTPSSADFPLLDYKFWSLWDEIIIKSYVDTYNLYNAKVRLNYRCVFKLKGNNVELTEANIEY